MIVANVLDGICPDMPLLDFIGQENHWPQSDFRKDSDVWDEVRIIGVFESQLSDRATTSKQTKEPYPEEAARLAKLRAEFKEMMRPSRLRERRRKS